MKRTSFGLTGFLDSTRLEMVYDSDSDVDVDADADAGAGTMLDVTQSWTLRLQHVVVPIAAQHTSGRTSWSKSVSVKCVAGQQIAVQVWHRR